MKTKNGEKRMIDNNVSKCLVCGVPTRCIVSIKMKATPVCDVCCRTITKQTVLEDL